MKPDVDYYDTPLIKAVMLGNLEPVKKLIKTDKVDIDQSRGYGDTALLVAAKLGELDIVKYLIDHGANLQHRNDAGLNVFVCAVSSGHIPLIQYLIELMKPNQEDINMAVLIALSTRHFNLDGILFMLKNFSSQLGDEQQLEELAEKMRAASYHPIDHLDYWKKSLDQVKQLMLLERNSPLFTKVALNPLLSFLTRSLEVERFILNQLPKNKFIEELTYRYTDENVVECRDKLLYFFRCTPSLKKLNLWFGRSVFDTPTKNERSIVRDIFEALSKNENLALEELNWSPGYEMDIESVGALATLLKENKTLRHLSLSSYRGNELNDAALEIIAYTINANPTGLKTLDLHFHQLGSKGEKAVASLLKYQQSAALKQNTTPEMERKQHSSQPLLSSLSFFASPEMEKEGEEWKINLNPTSC